jgi:hypothetical protein
MKKNGIHNPKPLCPCYVVEVRNTVAKNKKQKMGNTNSNPTEFASESNVSNNTANKAAQKNSNQSNR